MFRLEQVGRRAPEEPLQAASRGVEEQPSAPTASSDTGCETPPLPLRTFLPHHERHYRHCFARHRLGIEMRGCLTFVLLTCFVLPQYVYHGPKVG